MTSTRSKNRAGLIGLLALAFAFAAIPQADAAPKKPKTVEPAKPAGEVVEYASLEQRVGQELLIETTFKTTRRGTLIKYTQPTLTLKLGPEAGSIELSVPRETIKTITVVAPAASADEGKSGAKKN